MNTNSLAFNDSKKIRDKFADNDFGLTASNIGYDQIVNTVKQYGRAAFNCIYASQKGTFSEF